MQCLRAHAPVIFDPVTFTVELWIKHQDIPRILEDILDRTVLTFEVRLHRENSRCATGTTLKTFHDIDLLGGIEVWNGTLRPVFWRENNNNQRWSLERRRVREEGRLNAGLGGLGLPIFHSPRS
jgi:hypothetical protein